MKMNLLRLFGVVLIVALFVSIGVGTVCAGSDDEYITFSSNYTRNAVVSTSGPTENVLLWNKTASDFGGGWGDITGTPIVYNGSVYVPKWMDTTTGGVYQFDMLTGELLHTNTDFAAGSITISGNYLYATGTLKTDGTYSQGAVYCLYLNNLTTARSTSQITTSTAWCGFTSSPLADSNGNIWVYVPVTPDGKTVLYGYTPGLANEATPYTIELSGGNSKGKYVSPSINGNIIYVPNASGFNGYDISNPANPLLIGSFSGTSAEMVGTPVYADNIIYFIACENFTTHSGKIYAVDVSTSPYTQKWTVSYDANYGTTPIIYNGYLYALGYTGLYAYDLASVSTTLTHDWKQSPSTSYPYRGSPVIAGDILYYGTYGGTLYAVDVTTHAVLFTGGDGANCFDGQPAVADKILFIGNGGQSFYAFFSPETIYEGVVIASGTSGSLTLKDVLDAAQTAGHFTYNASSWNTIQDFNGIENTADYSKTWMCAYENNGDVSAYSLDDKIYPGAKIIYTYDEMDTTTWNVLRTHYKVIITAGLTPDESVNLQAGWNFISTPKTLAYSNASQVFAEIDLDGHSPMTWDAQAEGWIQISGTDKVVPLTGYWIYAKNSVVLNFTYDKTIPVVPASTTVYEGWDAVGQSGSSSTMTAADAFSNVDWASAWVWDVTTQSYTEILKTDTTTTLPTGSGIWLYVNDEEKGLQGHV